MHNPNAAAESGAQSVIVARTTYQLFMFAVTTLALAIMAVYYLVPLPDTVRQALFILDSLFCPILFYIVPLPDTVRQVLYILDSQLTPILL